MAKERFSLTSGKDLMWTVTDNESGIAIDFREGLFNDSQEVVICLKFTTFVVATTVVVSRNTFTNML